MKKKTIIIIMSVLLGITAIFDIFTTIRYPAITQLESNVIYLAGLGIFGLLFVKVAVLAFLIWLLSRVPKYKRSSNKYTIIYIILLLIAFQSIAAILNTRTANNIAEREGLNNPSDLTNEAVAKYQWTGKEKLIFYFGLIVLPATFFFTIGLLSFAITQKFEDDNE